MTLVVGVFVALVCHTTSAAPDDRPGATPKPRIIVTSDGEIDDQCSMIRFMLYTNECDVEGIVTSSSQYHWQGHKWAGDNWIDPDLAAYEKVYPNLVKHDPAYPTPEYLRQRTVLGNVKSEGDMAEATAGSNLIVKVLLDRTDERPVWLQAWGGMNTIARALKTIEEDHPERMAEAAAKCRFFAIWEQDTTYQDYIRPVWGKYEIPTIISDQFEAIAYRWKQIQPKEMQPYFDAAWMKENILENHGPLCSIYAAHEKTSERNNHEYYAGDFRSEGDSPAFLHTVVTGLRNMESPDWGGWGGRYVRVRENTWLDPVPVEGYTYPDGRWYTGSAWGRQGTRERKTSATHPEYREYFKPIWRWTPALQNDFAARADWCVKSYEDANHPPMVKLGHEIDLKVKPGGNVKLSAKGTTDPDGDQLRYQWWQYQEADTYAGTIEIRNANKQNASFTVPDDVAKGETIHVICEVTDDGSPAITRYQRIVLTVNDAAKSAATESVTEKQLAFPSAEGFGAYAAGGRGGKVYHVTTLEDSDAEGSLRHAVEAEGPRTVVFDVSGTIHLQDRLAIRNPFITIAGQTAPGDGVCLRDASLVIQANDVVVRFLRVRLGDVGKGGDAISISSGNRIIVDHCSASWSLDELISASTSKPTLSEVTVQWCFITNALNPKNHGFGSLIRGTGDSHYTFHHNLYAHNRGRNPRPGNYDTHPHDEDPLGLLLDFRNNLIYDFGGSHAGYNADKKSVTRLNYVGNALIPGAESSSNWHAYQIGSTYNRAYFADNLIDGRLPDDPWSVVDFREWTPEQIATYQQATPFETGTISSESSQSAAVRVLEIGGASLPRRDAIDLRVVDSVRARTGEFIKSQKDVGGWPELASEKAPADTDRDGMPDAWERANGLDANNAADGNADSDSDGYTNLEEYLNGLVQLTSTGTYAEVIGIKPRTSEKPRMIVTSDGEVDDECSLVRFLLYANDFDIEGIVTSSSQYHWQGHKWAGDDWAVPYLDAYAKVHANLVVHDARYPSPEFLRARTFLGNVKSEGDMEAASPGSQHIVSVLLDESDDRPIWLQAWGGVNTIARALKTIEEEHPDKMEQVAKKIRFYLIWEQDKTYQEYIRPNWGKFNIPTIISDQFIALFYHWKKYLPQEQQEFLVGEWMTRNILQGHGPLCSLYKAKENGDFRSEGDSPAFLHAIPTGLRSLKSPGWGGWGGRYTKVRENTWLDPVADPSYEYPEGRWYTRSAWGRSRLREEIPNDGELTAYLRPMWRWTEAIQNDFASRADWCVKPFAEANHPPVVMLAHRSDFEAKPGETVALSAKGTTDLDGDDLAYRWWQYREAGSYDGHIEIRNANNREATFTLPADAPAKKKIHIICEVTDSGSPKLTRYQRVVLKIAEEAKPTEEAAEE